MQYYDYYWHRGTSCLQISTNQNHNNRVHDGHEQQSKAKYTQSKRRYCHQHFQIQIVGGYKLICCFHNHMTSKGRIIICFFPKLQMNICATWVSLNTKWNKTQSCTWKAVVTDVCICSTIFDNWGSHHEPVVWWTLTFATIISIHACEIHLVSDPDYIYPSDI